MLNKTKKKPAFLIFSTSICIFVVVVSVLIMRHELMWKYKSSISDINSGLYQEAIDKLLSLGDYQDSLQYLDEAYYQAAKQYFNNGDFLMALDGFQKISNYKDSTIYIMLAESLIQFQKNSEDLAESDRDEYNSYIKQLDKAMQESPLNESLCKDLIQSINQINNRIHTRQEKENLYKKAVDYFVLKDYRTAFSMFTELGDYENSQQLMEKCNSILIRQSHSNTISAGIRYSAGVAKDGTVYFSEKNFAGIREIETWNNIVSISVSSEILVGLREDGKVVVAKQRPLHNYHVNASAWENEEIIAVSAGEQYIVGLKSDGTMLAQGNDGYGETNIDNWKDIIDIDTGWQHTVGLDSKGKIYIVGYNSDKLLNEIQANERDWMDIVSISTGGSTGRGNKGRGHIVGLKKDGHVIATGDNSYGQCNVDNWESIVAISAGDYHTVGLRSDGTVVTTQNKNDFPDSCREINTWTDIIAVSAGYGFTLGLKTDGTVVAAGNDMQGQTNVSTWENIAFYDDWDYK